MTVGHAVAAGKQSTAWGRPEGLPHQPCSHAQPGPRRAALGQCISGLIRRCAAQCSLAARQEEEAVKEGEAVVEAEKKEEGVQATEQPAPEKKRRNKKKKQVQRI